MSDLKFGIKAKSTNHCQTVVEARHFKLIIDEPASLGGSDEGANPVEYLIGALAGCLNVVGHLVAKEMGIELGGIELDIEGDLNPLKFMGKSEAERTGYKEIRVSVKPDMDVDDATKEKWLETVERRCPVSDNIANPTPMKISLG